MAMHTLESGINLEVRLLIFGVPSRGYVLIKGGLCLLKSQIICYLREGATFIQGAMFIVWAKCSRGYVYSRLQSILYPIPYAQTTFYAIFSNFCTLLQLFQFLSYSIFFIKHHKNSKSSNAQKVLIQFHRESQQQTYKGQYFSE